MDKPLSEKISAIIKQQHVHMRPRAYFIIGSVLLGAGLVASLLVAIFFVSVIIFRLRVNAPFSYLGDHGNLGLFAQNIPWIPIVIAIIGVTGGIIIMKKFDFSYRHAFLGIAGGVILSIGVVGLLFDTVGLPEQAEKVRPLQPFLHMEYADDSWVSGTILYLESNSLEVGTPNGTQFTILYDSQTDIIPDTPLQNGEWVQIIGERDDDEFEADQIMHRSTPRRNPGPFSPNTNQYPRYNYMN